MRDFEFTINANSQDPRVAIGDFIKIKTASIELRIIAETHDGRVLADLKMSEGSQVSLPEKYHTIRVENTTGSSTTAVLILGNGEVSDNQLSGNVSVSNAVSIDVGAAINNNTHTVGTTAVKILSASVTRKSIFIQNRDLANSIYIGKSSVTVANGFEIKAGESLVLDRAPEAEVWSVSSVAGNNVRSFEEIE